MLQFRLFGFPVTIQPFFWLIAGFLAYTRAERGRVDQLIVVALVVFISIIVHELGHAIAYRKFQGRNTQIVLHGMGGYATSQGHFTRPQHFLISLAGPVFGLGLFVIAHILLQTVETANTNLILFLKVLWWINLFWSILNLMPVFPLDGGQILQSILGPQRRRLLGWIGLGVGGALAAYGFSQGEPFIMILFGFMAYQNFQLAQTGEFPRRIF